MKHFPALFLLAATLRLAAADLYVSPSGSDTNPGTIGAPLATVVQARNAIRAIKSGGGLPAGGITVWLRDGYYNLASNLVFGAQDSGSASSPVVYASYAGEEAHITGGLTLDPAWFSLVDASSPVWSRLDPAAQGKVYAVNLASHGITNYGTLKPVGNGLRFTAAMELFFAGRPMTLAQWPNRGEAMARTIASPSTNQITYDGSRPERWSQASEIWIKGFWRYFWADYNLKATNIDTAAKIITFASVPGYGIDTNTPYYALNLLEELDEPGEYYLERTSGMLYFWPPSALAGALLQVSLLETNLVQIGGAQFLTWSNLVFEASRSHLLQIDSGDHNRVESCLLRNAGQAGVLLGGSTNGVNQCDIADCGEDGVRISGGDRVTLRAGGNFVTNCRIHRTARLNWTYTPGINLNNGCGNRAAHNLLDEMPHAAILFAGNNHLIEFNEIRRVCRYTSDVGAIYTSGRDWSYRGNVIQNNFIHHIHSTEKNPGAHGIYLDSCMSGVQIAGNVLWDIDNMGIHCNGGRDNLITNNLFANAAMALYDADIGRSYITNSTNSDWNLLKKLTNMNYQLDPWLTAYPACAAITNTWEGLVQGTWRNPEHCIFAGNAGWSNIQWMVEANSSHTGVFSVYDSTNNNAPAHAPLFDENASLDRSLRAAQLNATVTGFQPIPFAAIGRTMTGLPAAIRPPAAPVLTGQATELAGVPAPVALQWSDDSNLPQVQEDGFTLERRNEPDGPWQAVRAFGPDADFFAVAGLAPATAYAFRVGAFNSMGTNYSNILLLTNPPAYQTGANSRIEAETPLTIVADPGTHPIQIHDASLDSGMSVGIYDSGDTIRISFNITNPGTYCLSVRVRSGGQYGPMLFWPCGYRFKLDGGDIVLQGDPATLSNYETNYGGCYWGTLFSHALTLTHGVHAVDVIDETPWGVVDYLEFAPLTLSPATTFAAWQQAHFSADQIAGAAISGTSAKPAGDPLPNLLKYSLGLDPWTSCASDGIRAVLVAGKWQLTYAHPWGLTDVTNIVEASCDLKTWTPISQSSLGVNGGIETMQATDTVGTGTAPCRFIRLRVVRQP